MRLIGWLCKPVFLHVQDGDRCERQHTRPSHRLRQHREQRHAADPLRYSAEALQRHIQSAAVTVSTAAGERERGTNMQASG